ncbi:MAG: glycosyltransferase family 4 protein [Nanoarchaeota archaeon]
MKSLVLYPYPAEYDGQSLQGHYLLKGLQENGEEAIPCDRNDKEGKKAYYEKFKPDAVIGIGFWGDTPELVKHPLTSGYTPVPYYNANGWVANYHDILNALPLILATSNWVKSTYIRDGVKGDNIHVAPIGYDPEIFYPRKSYDVEVMRMRHSLGVEDDEIMITTGGGDVTSKGAQEILRALAKIDPMFPKWKYVCKVWPSKSTREHGKEEKKLIKELGIDQDKIVYCREKFNPDKMAVLLNACDIYAAPSRLEGFGMIQLEAQACGKPVVSINVGGPRDTIIDGETGFLVDVASEIKLESEWITRKQGFEKKHKVFFPEPKTFAYRANVDQLAGSLLKLMSNPDLRKKMGKAAAEHAYDTFNYKITAKHIADLVKKYVIKDKEAVSKPITNPVQSFIETRVK